MADILLPVWILYFGVGLILTVIFLTVAFVAYWWNNKRLVPESPILKAARKTHTTVVNLWAMNGFKQPSLLKKNTKGEPILAFEKDSSEGIRFDPRVQSGYVPDSHTLGGLKELNYSTALPFPLSHKNVLALKGIVEYTRKNHPTLNTLPDWLVLELTHTNKADLPHDCQNIVETFELESLPIISQSEQDSLLLTTYNAFKNRELREPTDSELEQEYTVLLNQVMKQHKTSWLVEEIKKIQDSITTLPVPNHRFFSWDWAFRNISAAFTSMDTRTMMQLFEAIAMKKAEQNQHRWTLFAFAALMVMVGGAVSFAIILSVAK